MDIYLKVKNILDPLIAALLFIILFPTIALISIIILVSSKGPVLIKQKRIGRKGKPFYAYKYRTMVTIAEQLRKEIISKNERDNSEFKLKYDIRITKFGRILRITGLDSLPQLINVILGDMSLVGPRPLFENELCFLGNEFSIIYYKLKPGLMPSEILFSTNEISSERDYYSKSILYYYNHLSLLIDLKIFLKYISFLGWKGY